MEGILAKSVPQKIHFFFEQIFRFLFPTFRNLRDLTLFFAKLSKLSSQQAQNLKNRVLAHVYKHPCLRKERVYKHKCLLTCLKQIDK